MGEIKSTLDLIMERTKNLTMSEEEKRRFKEKELAGKVKALVQRTMDGLITRERFREDVLALQAGSGDEPLKRMLVEELTGRIELGKEHEPCLSLLKTSTGLDPGPFQALIHHYEAKAAGLRDDHESALRKRLAERAISGSAVMANLEADTEWKEAMQILQQELNVELRKRGEMPI